MNESVNVNVRSAAFEIDAVAFGCPSESDAVIVTTGSCASIVTVYSATAAFPFPAVSVSTSAASDTAKSFGRSLAVSAAHVSV